MRTLIVEDNHTNRVLLQSVLSVYGECHVAANGREAVAAFRAAQERGQMYDLICMDIMMPEMDGQTALKEIHSLEKATGTESTKRVKIIMTTAQNDEQNIVQSMKESCDAYMLKPIRRSELVGHIKKFQLV